MTWLKIDDKINTHAKWVALDVLERALWFDAAVWSAAHWRRRRDPDHMLRLIAFSAKVPEHELDRCVAALDRSGLVASAPQGRWWRLGDRELARVPAVEATGAGPCSAAAIRTNARRCTTGCTRRRSGRR